MKQLFSSSGNKTWPRRLHAVIGIVSSVNLLVLLMSGMLMQHRETFGLEDRVVSRTFLPDSYRPDDGPDGVRADIVATDLHSGRLFGPIGLFILDAVTILWAILLLSGIYLFISRQLRTDFNLKYRVWMPSVSTEARGRSPQASTHATTSRSWTRPEPANKVDIRS